MRPTLGEGAISLRQRFSHRSQSFSERCNSVAVDTGADPRREERLAAGLQGIQIPLAVSRNANFWILPVLVLGISANTTKRGHL